MPENPIARNEFLESLNTAIEQNMSNEQFGVSELADVMNMSRSNLLRKVKKETNLSVSQLINQVRLTSAMGLLRTTSLNVSEVSLRVGFNSPSYFIKCFRERYGYPPGEVGEHAAEEIPAAIVNAPSRIREKLVMAGAVMVLAAITWFLIQTYSVKPTPVEKSIAVLPFKNESNDSSNVYLINGLMESALNNLQQIKSLNVVSRTTAEKYRNTTRSIPEIAKELNVNYFVEGSGQKIGDEIVLNIQLIDGTRDKHLWAKQYRRKTTEIFSLQEEIARNIADEIEVIISPAESKQIEKKLTENVTAYDAFLKGKYLLTRAHGTDLSEAVPLFKEAVAQDPKFGSAYALLGITYYYLDLFQVEKRYAAALSSNADKAMLYNPDSEESLMVMALDYASRKDFKQSALYFEKALEYNPRSALVLQFLNEFYSLHVPNPTRHLEIALKRVKVDMPSTDSFATAFNYFHLSNALFENGFLDEALTYVNRSLAYDSNGYLTRYFKVYVVTMKENDVSKTKALMLAELHRDTNRFDIRQEVGKICFMMRDYKEAYHYYSRFVKERDMMRLNLFHHEDLRIAIVFEKMGMKKEAAKFAASFKEYADNDLTLYKNFHLAYYWAYRGDLKKSLAHMKLFADEKTIPYAVLLVGDDPILEPVADLPEFKAIIATMKNTFDTNHERMARMLKEEGLP